MPARNIDARMSLTKRRVMSGMRPTGDLHLGHLVGVLTLWETYSENDDAFFEICLLYTSRCV